MRLAFVLVAAAGLSGCGWHSGLVLPVGYETVGVEVFETEREILERGLEPPFADAMGAAVADLVQAPLAHPASADVLVRGRIVDFRRRTGIRTPGGILSETGLYVEVEGELVDRRDGRSLTPKTKRHVWSGYALDATAEENESVALGRALEHVARTLVLDLFALATEAGSTSGVGASASTDAPR